MKWIITANTNDCRIYEYQDNTLKQIKKISHPENKLKESEIGEDRPGRYRSDYMGRGAYSPHTSIEDVQDNDFAGEIARELNEARNNNSLKEMIVIMPPRIEGLFSKHLNKNVKDLITSTIQKNLMHLKEKELLDYLNEFNRFELRK